eukprot:4790099-Pyramimonas_sp.AAC.1
MENQPTPSDAEDPSQARRNRGQGAADLHARRLDATGHANVDWAASREADGPMRGPRVADASITGRGGTMSALRRHLAR